MTEDMPSWAAWGSLAEEELASEAEALLDLYGQRYDTLPARIRRIVGKIEVED